MFWKNLDYASGLEHFEIVLMFNAEHWGLSGNFDFL